MKKGHLTVIKRYFTHVLARRQPAAQGLRALQHLLQVQQRDADIAAQIGASAALTISDIPWAGPVAGCRVGYIDEEFVLNPTPEQREKSTLELLVTGGRDGVVMVEGGADEAAVPQNDAEQYKW